MSIQRKSELVKLVVEVLPDHSVATTATYASGAWDGDKQEWVGKPHEIEEPFNSFAHDAGRIKGIVGQMLLRVAQGHEALKAAHEGQKAAYAAEMQAHHATHAKVDKLQSMVDRAFTTINDLMAQNSVLWEQIQATPVVRKNPLLHRLTGGRAGR